LPCIDLTCFVDLFMFSKFDWLCRSFSKAPSLLLYFLGLFPNLKAEDGAFKFA